MKRYLIMPLIFSMLTMFILFMFKYMGYFIATMLRNDLVYFMLLIPVISLILIIGLIYMIMGMKNEKGEWSFAWYKILPIIVFVYFFAVLIAITNIYLTTGIAAQILIVGIPVFILLISNVFLVLNYIKTKKTTTKIMS